MKYRVAELEAVLLDAAVAMAEGVDVVSRPWGMAEVHPNCDEEAAERVDEWCRATRTGYTAYSPSTDWGRGGPILKRKRINLEVCSNVPEDEWSAYFYEPEGWHELRDDSKRSMHTCHCPLIAAMRVLVHGHYGDEVEIEIELPAFS